MDLIMMPVCQDYKYILVVYCMASAFIFAEKMKSKTGETTAEAYQAIMYKNCSFKNSFSDSGSAAFKQVIKDTGANHTYLH